MRIRTLATIVMLSTAALLSACATATPYQPVAKSNATSGGYTESKLAPDRFRVTFSGNSLTGRETVERYLLYRAAELTVAEGYDWFSLDDRQTDRTARTYVEPDPFGGPSFRYGYWHPYWNYYGRGYGWRRWDPFWGDPFWHDRVDVRTVERFDASAEITLQKGPVPAGDRRAIDARAVLTDLGPKIQRPAT